MSDFEDDEDFGLKETGMFCPSSGKYIHLPTPSAPSCPSQTYSGSHPS